MHLNEYQEMANSTDQQPLGEDLEPNSSEMLVPLLGMVGELGELLAEYKNGSGTDKPTVCSRTGPRRN